MDFGSNVSLPTAAAVNSIALVRAFSSGALGLEISASEEQGKSKTAFLKVIEVAPLEEASW